MSIKGLKAEDLYSTCEVCGGTGRKKEAGKNWTRESSCLSCAQTGIVLTDEGKVIKEFLRKLDLRHL